MPEKTQHLYRWYDENDVLLYVGVSVNAYFRAKSHKTNASWWAEAATMRLESFDTREAVLAAEKLAIQTEHPVYNVTHAQKYQQDSGQSWAGTTASQFAREKDAVAAYRESFRTKDKALRRNAKKALERYGWDWRSLLFLRDWDQYPKPPWVDREDWHFAVELWRSVRGAKEPLDFLRSMEDGLESDAWDYGYDPDDIDEVMEYDWNRAR